MSSSCLCCLAILNRQPQSSILQIHRSDGTRNHTAGMAPRAVFVSMQGNGCVWVTLLQCSSPCRCKAKGTALLRFGAQEHQSAANRRCQQQQLAHFCPQKGMVFGCTDPLFISCISCLHQIIPSGMKGQSRMQRRKNDAPTLQSALLSVLYLNFPVTTIHLPRAF